MMPGRAAARQAAEPAGQTASAMSRSRSRGGLEVVPGGYGTARGEPRLAAPSSPGTPTALAPVRDGAVPRAHLLWAAAALLLEVIADDAPGGPDTSAVALERELGLAEPDRVLFPALIRLALGLVERRAGPDAAEAALVAELAGLFGEVKRSAPPAAEPPWPGEPLTASEARVLRYLPTHLGAAEIAAELYLSANTVKTHLRHLYRKLGAHSRPEAVQRARAIGLLTKPAVGQNQVLLSERPVVARSAGIADLGFAWEPGSSIKRRTPSASSKSRNSRQRRTAGSVSRCAKSHPPSRDMRVALMHLGQGQTLTSASLDQRTAAMLLC
jgi:DNA-binding CsgD family transcriptional regulator